MNSDELTETSPCERFAEFRERGYAVFYAPNTSEGEEEYAYAVLFNLLHKKTAIMMISPADPDRYEPVYRDSLKYHLPITRHTRLFTSKVPKNNRVYFIEDPEPVKDFYACADVVLLGGTLTENATSVPDVYTPLLAGKPVIAGPGTQRHPEVAAAVKAEAILQASTVEDMAQALLDLMEDPEATKAQAMRAWAWLDTREGGNSP